jgi:hypothetical protein
MFASFLLALVPKLTSGTSPTGSRNETKVSPSTAFALSTTIPTMQVSCRRMIPPRSPIAGNRVPVAQRAIPPTSERYGAATLNNPIARRR